MPAAKHSDTVAFIRSRPAGRLTAGGIFLLLCTAALALSHGPAPQAAAASGPAALLHVVQNGGGSVTVQGPGQAPETCEDTFYPNRENGCVYGAFSEGQAVTLTARATAPAEFIGWSDERCPSGRVETCTLTLADEQTVVALFSPLRMTVGIAGGGEADTVKITDAAGRTCQANVDCPSFALFSELTLVATADQPVAAGDEPRWNPDDCHAIHNGSDGSTSTCSVTVIGAQQANVGFNGVAPSPNAPPRVDVIFRARKTGTGSGTIRGALDCGSRCSVRARFGKRVTLVADAAPGSRFVRWIGGCGTAPTCSLQAHSTSVAAEFAAVRPAAPRFVARVGKITPIGRGRRRQIQMTVQVNAPATLRAILAKGRRRVATRIFSVAPGSRALHLRVPRRTKAGRYRLTLTIRDRRGASPVHVARSVRLRR